MSYIVIQAGSSEEPEYREFDDLDRAVAHLEQVCNGPGAADARLCRLDPVEFQLKKYFKVEISADGSVPETPAPTAEVVEASVFDPLPTVEAGEPESGSPGRDHQLSGESRRGLFGR